MKSIKEMIAKGDRPYLIVIKVVIIVLFVYSTLPIIAPISFKLGAPKIGVAIHKIYHVLCHQRVERSIYLFGEESLVQFYTVDELKEKHQIPKVNPDPPYDGAEEFYFGYPYWGNEQIGYKIAYCIRDTALYSTTAFTALLMYSLYAFGILKKKIPVLIYVALMIPMAFDGVFQTMLEYGIFTFIKEPLYSLYVDNIAKRIITGALFGVGFGIFTIQNMFDAISWFDIIKNNNNTVDVIKPDC
ncbi:MAG TPA: DUF2085 domain-containing protein [Candidatus Dojkabacteria bacterium]|nr:DUF2085 domain-containing protein [Candidatus Dojkabacteria bacterium]